VNQPPGYPDIPPEYPPGHVPGYHLAWTQIPIGGIVAAQAEAARQWAAYRAQPPELSPLAQMLQATGLLPAPASPPAPVAPVQPWSSPPVSQPAVLPSAAPVQPRPSPPVPQPAVPRSPAPPVPPRRSGPVRQRAVRRSPAAPRPMSSRRYVRAAPPEGHSYRPGRIGVRGNRIRRTRFLLGTVMLCAGIAGFVAGLRWGAAYPADQPYSTLAGFMILFCPVLALVGIPTMVKYRPPRCRCCSRGCPRCKHKCPACRHKR